MNFYLCVMCISIVVVNFTQGHYTQQFAVHIEGGSTVADSVATDHGFINEGPILENFYLFTHNGIVKRSLTKCTEKNEELAFDIRVRWAEQQKVKRRIKRDYKFRNSDPKWPSMWYLNRGPGLDMNVVPVWMSGITGKGAVVTILDDGLEREHPDLLKNYDSMASYDVNGHDPDPSPRYDMIDSNRHGTRCAGEVAAAGNNSICALGIAYGARVGGVRMLDGDVTDAVEARSLSLNPHHIDIYSASWGPDDDGKTVDGPGELAMRAFMEGAAKGRNGKGSIFVWASGNGGRDHDNCNCDGYTNSIYTLSISSATERGNVPWYSEACSSTLASTYSSGSVGERQIVTTDLRNSCTSSHTGTSASAPLAAGICALALEANPNLTWRDMQHIVIHTAKSANLYSNDWHQNGVGRNVSHNFGYGLMDAFAMVKLSKKWITVPEQHKCEIVAPQGEKSIPAKSAIVLELVVKECEGVEVLEHVQAKLTLFSQRRGDLNIQLTSPMGTKVTLLAHRIHDTSRAGFNQWPFMSVHSWGETPFGIWHLEIHNDGRLLGRATLQTWSLILYGTKSFLPSLSNNIYSNKTMKNRGFASNKKHKKLKIKYDPEARIHLNTAKSLNNSMHADKSKTVFPKNAKNFVPNFRSTNSSKNSKKDNPTDQYTQKNHKNATGPTLLNSPSKNSSSARVYFSISQKLKEDKSRGINLNRKLKVCSSNSKDLPSNNKTASVPIGKNLLANFSAWNLTLYGTASPPAFKLGASSSSGDDSNSIDTVPDQVNAENTKFFLTVDESSSGCLKSNGHLCLGLCLAIILIYNKFFFITDDSFCVLAIYPTIRLITFLRLVISCRITSIFTRSHRLHDLRNCRQNVICKFMILYRNILKISIWSMLFIYNRISILVMANNMKSSCNILCCICALCLRTARP